MRIEYRLSNFMLINGPDPPGDVKLPLHFFFHISQLLVKAHLRAEGYIIRVVGELQPIIHFRFSQSILDSLNNSYQLLWRLKFVGSLIKLERIVPDYIHVMNLAINFPRI
ncbi:109aa long hypothetical protein [Pyrococcus horikoshii OT3]|uniref:Uncharacterized protein n=1 Tax=Pyrococcus horikoshii (strain ATCC 700860 / DSM 12428 / JCM 9974 / NBRC 100139 / OT-3) TaxID=70601 RepID=O57862_PYRHO|nr:109aa long hypothetical protein [Pyrococcus horikoshii OT3]